ncbi:Asp23/Gls24 family envelope stress response protein [Eggerthellaceae bacterium zg-887]|uniref:Asp23/Gls24 family envelope stress response protein n=1 Tax=Xiamenia xianingshaonis TaxID=2682776 RepID=UPI0013EA5D43|nr:Asp23/Gls24 family envelope stress response protein [Xiamenia xianingshaonis]NGM17790.1 Asp23/Gls24 family envelope stress response protein [Eggerthellaceae bacterium zg-893]NHM15320.1 Asp23/Gls24 family envelope stress response protein [Xiamenia xianingshaonis]
MTELNLESMALASGVVETIIALAAAEVEGVAAVGSASSSNPFALFASKPSTQGIEVAVNEDEKLDVSVHVDVYYGHVLPDVAANLRAAVSDAVASQVGAEVGSVDVFIDGISFVR